MSQLDEIRKERLEKIELLRKAGMEAYPAQTTRTHTIAEFLKNHQGLDEQNEVVALAGRIFSIRDQGGVMFVDLFDGTEKTQLVLQAEQLGEEALALFRNTVDASDVIEVHGEAFTTKRGMPSLQVNSWRMLAKSLQPVPDQWYGLKDEDERYRKRYIDILLSKDIADRIRRRSVFWNTIRTHLLERDFVEVETPVLETTTGGADARPFETHHNALDIPVYLRISAGELWQKRLIVAGLPKVFEIGRIFRNEGMSAEHLQDYTQLEYYEAFKDYRQGMEAITDLYRTIAEKVYGTQKFPIKGFDIDLSAAWQTYDYCTLIKDAYGIDPLTTNADEVRGKLDELSIAYDTEGFNRERGIDILWKQLRKSLAGPGFLIGVPAYMEPLAKRSSTDPRVVERFQVLLAGSEMGKGFSELNDPVDQAGRFAHQQELREQGDEEAQMNDASYVEALEYGMPPAFGFGVSERLFSFLEGVPVREAQIFPLMRPKDGATSQSKNRQSAIAVVQRTGLEPWQILNTVAHLSAELGIREGRQLLTQDSMTTADGTRIPMNIKHAIVIKEADTANELRTLLMSAKSNGLQIAAFTREMIETTNDRKIIEHTSKTNFDDIDMLGVLIFGDVDSVEALTKDLKRYS